MAELIKTESLDADLEILQPTEKFVVVGEEKIYVKEYTFGKLLKVLKHLGSIFKTLDSLQHLEELTIEQALLELISSHEDEVLHLISYSTNKPIEYFEDIDAVSGLDLAIMTYEVNKDFFVQQLLPKLRDQFQFDSPDDQTEEIEENNKAVTKASKAKKAGSTSSKN